MQLEFLWRNERSLREELERRTGQSIELIVTDNSSNVMTYRARSAGPAQLRIHRMFLTAGPEVIEAVSTWLTKRRTRKSAAIIDGFIKEHQHMLQASRRQVRIRTKGLYFDLKRLYTEVNEREFEGRVDCPITWGRMPTVSRRRSIRLGSYTPEDHLIRIHPLLDQEFVPEYFVKYIVFHEMLHADLGIEETPSGRRRVHTPEFNRRERAYAEFALASAWHDDDRNLARLLKTRRKAG